MRVVAGSAVALLMVAACGGGEDPPPPTTSTTAPPTTLGPPPLVTVLPTTSQVAAPTYELAWDRLRHRPFYGFDDVTEPGDPFWHLHTNAEEAFWFSLELYTTGFGEAWEGQTGTFDLGCGAELTGICLHLDPDGHGDRAVDLNADFRATGTIRIDRLDDQGYDLTLRDVRFGDGSTLPGPTRLLGGA